MSIVLKIFGYVFALLALLVLWRDLTATDDPSVILGQLWFEWHAPSLQVSEAIISRYIDPCGLIVGLGCEPFLWHPLISTTLGWPAVLVFALLALLFAGLAKLGARRRLRRVSSKSLRRSGK